MYQRICSPVLWAVFLFCWWLLLLCKSFLVWYSPIYFLLLLLPGEIYLIKKLLQAMSKILLPLFSSRIFIVLCLIFKSLIHFEFNLVYGIGRWSSFIFLHVSVQFSQHHLLNKLSLSHFMCLLPLSNINRL